MRAQVSSRDWPIYAGLRDVWRRYGSTEGRQREFFVQDPDGYLVMIAQKLDERPAA